MDQGEAITTAARALREQELLRRIHEQGDTRARDQLAEEMLPLARALAGRYANRGEPLDDLVQVACIGIMKAIDDGPWFENQLATLHLDGKRCTFELEQALGAGDELPTLEQVAIRRLA